MQCSLTPSPRPGLLSHRSAARAIYSSAVSLCNTVACHLTSRSLPSFRVPSDAARCLWFTTSNCAVRAVRIGYHWQNVTLLEHSLLIDSILNSVRFYLQWHLACQSGFCHPHHSKTWKLATATASRVTIRVRNISGQGRGVVSPVKIIPSSSLITMQTVVTFSYRVCAVCGRTSSGMLRPLRMSFHRN